MQDFSREQNHHEPIHRVSTGEKRKGKFPDAASLMELTPLWRERDCLQFTPPAEEIFSSLLELLISALGNASLEWQPLEESLSSQ